MKCYSGISIRLRIPFVIVKTYPPNVSGAVARDELKALVSSDDAKKCQQSFLAPLPGMALGVNLFTKVHKHGNISKRLLLLIQANVFIFFVFS